MAFKNKKTNINKTIGVSIILFIHIFIIHIFMVFTIFSNTIGNIFYAINTHNMLLVEAIAAINPGIVCEKYKERRYPRYHEGAIPLTYAVDRRYISQDIALFLLEETYTYYKKMNRMDELNRILYFVLINYLANDYATMVFSAKSHESYFNFPNRIFELGISVDYEIYKRISYRNVSEDYKEVIKKYLESKGMVSE